MSILAKRLLRSLLGARYESVSAGVATTVGEITPCNARPVPLAGKRLNILLPSINIQHLFGGIHTALQLYEAASAAFPRTRIITLDSAPDGAACARFPEHTQVPNDQESEAERQIVPFSDRYGKTLPVAREDVWLATAWWTAYAAQRLSCWQAEQFGTAQRVAYLIQDFEPGFYPWSSRYALALSTYRPNDDLAVFNTALLRDFFAGQGITYLNDGFFEPTLNDALLDPLQELRRRAPVPRRRRMVVYGRPSTQRNAFELICEGLRLWGWRDARSAEWEVVAPGEISEDIDLGPLKLRGLGKLGLDAYAELLSTSAIGISLMVSPHPSYPPLEMSAFGMSVLTNSYANKKLSTAHKGIVDLEGMTPEHMAAQLSAICDAWEQREMMPIGSWPDDEGFLHGAGVGSMSARVASFLGQ